MTYRKIAPAAIVCALSVTAIAPAYAASVADWRYDLDQLIRHVRVTHPDPFNQVGELTFLRAVQALEDDLHELTEEQRVVRVMRIMAMLGDAHSLVEPRTEAFAAWYPIRIVEFTDGYFITSAHTRVADLAGAQVLSIGGRPIAEVAENGRDLLAADNEFWRRETLYPILNAGVMKGLGYAREDGAISLRLRLPSGRVVERTLTPMRSATAFTPDQASFDWRFGRSDVSGPGIAPSTDYVSAFRGLRAGDFSTLDTQRPPHLSLRSLNALPLSEHDAYYIMINIWQGTQQEGIPDFFARAMRDVDAQRPRRLIIDLRLNVGGDGSNAWPVIRELLARGANQPWRELYVLTSGRTYSASINFLGPLLLNVPATLVGEPIGGGFNLYGDYSTFQLERTGLELRVSAQRHQAGSLSTDLRNVIPVDYPARFSFRDYVAGRDPAVDPILAGEEMRGIAIVALADGGAAARRVYLDRRERFGNLSWWAPPSEPELRRVGRDLWRANRRQDAIETYRLTTEVHPTEWRSWFNLANALRQDGQLPEALEMYQRALALNDPTNFNQAYIAETVIPQIETALAQREGARQ